MAAVACLRVLVDGNRTEVPAEALAPLVAKYATVFLEVYWSFPRHSQALNAYSYLLSDPRVDELDTVELARLSQSLQEQLFGTGSEDGVQLVLFEGDAEAMNLFAGYSADDVLAAMRDPDRLPVGGRLRRIAPDGSLIDMPEIVTAEPLDDHIFGHSIDGAQGVYLAAKQAFIGDVISCTPAAAPTYYSLVDGEEHLPEDAESFDAACVMTALRFLVDFPASAPLYVPVSFSTLVRASQREAYVELLRVLPPETRRRLAATVYDVPRAPTFQAIQTIRSALDPSFLAIDLRTQDPDFQIQELADRTVNSVTFILPPARPDQRLAALRRFADHGADYRRRHIWSGVTNVRFRAERELAIALRIPFLTGSGICRIQSQPIGGRPWPIEDLPLLSIHAAPTRVPVPA